MIFDYVSSFRAKGHKYAVMPCLGTLHGTLRRLASRFRAVVLSLNVPFQCRQLELGLATVVSII